MIGHPVTQHHERDDDEEMNAIMKGHVGRESTVGRVPFVLGVVEREGDLIEPCCLQERE